MDYTSDNITAANTAIQTYSLVSVTPDPEDEAAVAAEDSRQSKWATAMTHAAPVVRIVSAYDVLKQDREDGIIDAEGTELLARLSYHIQNNGWHGKKDEAYAIHMATVAELNA